MCKKCSSQRKHHKYNKSCNNGCNNMNAVNYANMPIYGRGSYGFGNRFSGGFGGGFGANNLWPFLLFPFFF